LIQLQNSQTTNTQTTNFSQLNKSITPRSLPQSSAMPLIFVDDYSSTFSDKSLSSSSTNFDGNELADIQVIREKNNTSSKNRRKKKKLEGRGGKKRRKSTKRGQGKKVKKSKPPKSTPKEAQMLPDSELSVDSETSIQAYHQLQPNEVTTGRQKRRLRKAKRKAKRSKNNKSRKGRRKHKKSRRGKKRAKSGSKSKSEPKTASKNEFKTSSKTNAEIEQSNRLTSDRNNKDDGKYRSRSKSHFCPKSWYLYDNRLCVKLIKSKKVFRESVDTCEKTHKAAIAGYNKDDIADYVEWLRSVYMKKMKHPSSGQVWLGELGDQNDDLCPYLIFNKKSVMMNQHKCNKLKLRIFCERKAYLRVDNFKNLEKRRLKQAKKQKAAIDKIQKVRTRARKRKNRGRKRPRCGESGLIHIDTSRRHAADLEEIPWAAHLVAKHPDTWFWGFKTQHICSGVLIESCWVLISAQCIDHINDLSSVEIRLGDVRPDVTDIGEQVFMIKKVIKHPQFYANAYYNDIALLELDNNNGTAGTCVKFDNYVQPVCLPKTYDEVREGTMCQVAGYHVQQNLGKEPKTMDTVLSTFVPFNECNVGALGVDPYEFVCNRYGDKNGCIMDFGATYTCESNDRMVNTIWGIAGFMQNYHQCGRLVYNMFTSVANFRCWIDKTLLANGVDNSTNANPFVCDKDGRRV